MVCKESQVSQEILAKVKKLEAIMDEICSYAAFVNGESYTSRTYDRIYKAYNSASHAAYPSYPSEEDRMAIKLMCLCELASSEVADINALMEQLKPLLNM